MADPYYDGIVGVDEAFLFPPEVMAAIAGSKELTAVADRLIQSYTKAISDNNRKQFATGEADPTAPEDLIPGRLFYNTTERATKQFNGTYWQLLGGPVDIPWKEFFTVPTGYRVIGDDKDGYLPIVKLTGKRVEFTVLVEKTGAFVHGHSPLYVKDAFVPDPKSIKMTKPFSAIQSGGTGLASVVAAGIQAPNQICLWSPNGTSTQCLIHGEYFTK